MYFCLSFLPFFFPCTSPPFSSSLTISSSTFPTNQSLSLYSCFFHGAPSLLKSGKTSSASVPNWFLPPPLQRWCELLPYFLPSIPRGARGKSGRKRREVKTNEEQRRWSSLQVKCQCSNLSHCWHWCHGLTTSALVLVAMCYTSDGRDTPCQVSSAGLKGQGKNIWEKALLRNHVLTSNFWFKLFSSNDASWFSIHPSFL